MIHELAEFFATQMPAKPDPNDSYSSREDYERALHQWHVRGVERRRRYYSGRQYDELNAACLAAALAQARQEATTDATGAALSEKDIARGGAMGTPPLPEHIRMHEYTSTIRSSVEFLTARLVSGFGLTVAAPEGVEGDENTDDDPRVSRELSRSERAREVVLAAFQASPKLAGKKVGQLNWTTVVRDALQAGDVPVLLRWDPDSGDDLNGQVWLEFWPSEGVDMRWSEVDALEKVIIRQQQWRRKQDSQDEELVTVRREWEVLTDDEPPDELSQALRDDEADEPLAECVERWWIERGPNDTEEELIKTIRWGVPFLPWWALRASGASLDSLRGDSVITDVAMKTADRLNALEDVAWKIARYNSHATIAVVGNQAMLATFAAGVIHRDVADILPLPTETEPVVLELPTDPKMIEHQREVLLDQLYEEFGLTRTDQGALENLGQVTGYALEILNQRADGTFDMLQQRLGHDVLRVANLILDCTAYWRDAGPGERDPEAADPLADVDPVDSFPDRDFEVTLGGGSVVDQVLLRESVVAGLISRRSALRQMGWSVPDIDRNERELAEQRAQEAEANRSAFLGGGTEGGSSSGGRNDNNGRNPRGTRSGTGRVANTASVRGEGR